MLIDDDENDYRGWPRIAMRNWFKACGVEIGDRRFREKREEHAKDDDQDLRPRLQGTDNHVYEPRKREQDLHRTERC